MLYSDLREVKGVLEIDSQNNIEDKRLLWWIEQLSGWLEDNIFHRDLSYKIRTEYYSGTGTQALLLKHRPVYPAAAPGFASSLPFQALTVNVDDAGYFGSSGGAFSGTDMVYGQDYCLRIDQTDGSSRSAVLIRIENYWNRPSVRQVGLLTPFLSDVGIGNIKVTYTAGYTVNTLPAQVRMALDQLVAATRYLFPLGVFLASESYEDRAISLLNERRDALFAAAKPLVHSLRNWTF